jgi:hypothetical protein
MPGTFINNVHTFTHLHITMKRKVILLAQGAGRSKDTVTHWGGVIIISILQVKK